MTEFSAQRFVSALQVAIGEQNPATRQRQLQQAILLLPDALSDAEFMVVRALVVTCVSKLQGMVCAQSARFSEAFLRLARARRAELEYAWSTVINLLSDTGD